MHRLHVIVSLFCILAVSPCHAAGNVLPAEAEEALAKPADVELFSLEPWAMPGGDADRLHERAVLGSVYLSHADGLKATAAISTALAGWDMIDPGCSDPRQGLRIRKNHEVFDFLISYECHEVQVYKDGQLLTRLGAFGEATVLNDLLIANQIPVSRSGQMMSH